MSEKGKALELFRLVASLTKENEMDWSPSEISEDIFESMTSGGFTLKVFPFKTSKDDDGPPSLTVYGADDNMIFDITSDVDGLSAQELRDFYFAVRASALDIDAKLQAVIDDLTNAKEKAS
jgi:hypothetical protein